MLVKTVVKEKVNRNNTKESKNSHHIRSGISFFDAHFTPPSYILYFKQSSFYIRPPSLAYIILHYKKFAIYTSILFVVEIFVSDVI